MRFKIFKNNEMNIVEKKYGPQMILLMEMCFNITCSTIQLQDWLSEMSIIFIGFDNNNQVIGHLAIGNEVALIVNKTNNPFDHKLETYTYHDNGNILTNAQQRMYPGILQFDKNNFVDNADTHNKIKAKKIYPCINGLCRNPNKKFKVFGEAMVQYTCDYFAMIGEKTIYAVAESTIDKQSYSNNKCGLKQYKNDADRTNSLYFKSNMKLLKYYSGIGFNIVSDHYFIDICNEDNGYVLYNFLKKKI